MGRPNRKWQLLGVIGALALVVAVCMLVPGAGEDRKEEKTPAKATQESGKIETPQQPPAPSLNVPVELKDGIGRLGDPESPVKLDVFFPGHSGCGNETADFAYRVYEANKDRMQVVFVDFDSSGGSQYQGAAGLHCSGVAINGKQQFDIGAGSEDEQSVEFTSNFGDRWDETKFLSALDVAFQEAYGEPSNHDLPEAKPPGADAAKAGPMGATPKAPAGEGEQ